MSASLAKFEVRQTDGTTARFVRGPYWPHGSSGVLPGGRQAIAYLAYRLPERKLRKAIRNSNEPLDVIKRRAEEDLRLHHNGQHALPPDDVALCRRVLTACDHLQSRACRRISRNVKHPWLGFARFFGYLCLACTGPLVGMAALFGPLLCAIDCSVLATPKGDGLAEFGAVVMAIFALGALIVWLVPDRIRERGNA